VALAIVAIALVPLLRLHLLSLDATMRAQSLTTATLLAQEHMALMPPFPEPGEEKGGFDDPKLAHFHWQTMGYRGRSDSWCISAAHQVTAYCCHSGVGRRAA
jgi:hypothetical protein